jgi:hypothetical protein
LKGALEVGLFTLWELCEGNLEGGFPCWDPGAQAEKALEMASISIGTLLENLEVGSYTRDFVRWMKEALGMQHFSLKRLSTEGLWGGHFYWGPWKIC